MLWEDMLQWISTPSHSHNNNTTHHSNCIGEHMLIYVVLIHKWDGFCFGLCLWEASVCPCWRMSKGCSKHRPCACVGVGVINAQQAGGQTDGEVFLWMLLGLFLPLNQAKWQQPTFLHIHLTTSGTQQYYVYLLQSIKVPSCLFFTI